MVDVTDKMALPSRNRGISSPGGSGMGSIKDVKTLLTEQEPMPGSSSLSAKQVDVIMHTTAKVLGDGNTVWSKRISAMQTFRRLCSDPLHHNQIVGYLRHLMPPIQSAVKDPRSQVCREACVTVAYVAQQLGVRSENFMETIMGTLFTLLVANAKIVSTSGGDTIMIIYESVHTHRLFPPLQNQMKSKSKEIRRTVCNVLKVILRDWPPTIIQKQCPIINEITKKGLTDANEETRVGAKECFTYFQKLFPTAANAVFDSLEPGQKRNLLAAMDLQEAAMLREESELLSDDEPFPT